MGRRNVAITLSRGVGVLNHMQFVRLEYEFYLYSLTNKKIKKSDPELTPWCSLGIKGIV